MSCGSIPRRKEPDPPVAAPMQNRPNPASFRGVEEVFVVGPVRCFDNRDPLRSFPRYGAGNGPGSKPRAETAELPQPVCPESIPRTGAHKASSSSSGVDLSRSSPRDETGMRSESGVPAVLRLLGVPGRVVAAGPLISPPLGPALASRSCRARRWRAARHRFRLTRQDAFHLPRSRLWESLRSYLTLHRGDAGALFQQPGRATCTAFINPGGSSLVRCPGASSMATDDGDGTRCRHRCAWLRSPELARWRCRGGPSGRSGGSRSDGR